ncbi:hypothetical protein JDW21_19040 [Bacillus subtilis]|uniref:hypothetical protein n=1 Tax=Bacillus subtilis TaxID=1423 RepID=UPI002ED28AD4
MGDRNSWSRKARGEMRIPDKDFRTHDRDSWWKRDRNRDKLIEMKKKAIRENDSITYRAIQLYESSGNDVTVLVKMIKDMYERNFVNGGDIT